MEDSSMAKKKAAKKTAKKAAAKKTTKKKGAKKTAAQEPLIVASKVKAYVKSKGLMTASDSLEAINKKIYALLDEGTERTTANRRSTLKPQDL
jgi:nucleoid-associated protein YgaU